MRTTSQEHNARTSLVVVLLLIILGLSTVAGAAHERPEGEIYAILVAVTKYDGDLTIKSPYSLKRSIPVMKDALNNLAARLGKKVHFCTLTDDMRYKRGAGEFCTTALPVGENELTEQGWPSATAVGEVLTLVREKARRRDDTVIFYFVGHGINREQEILLQLAPPEKSKKPANPSNYDLKNILEEFGKQDTPLNAQHRIVILDMCQKETAGLGGSVTSYDGVARKADTLVVIASQSGLEAAIAPNHGTGYFTLALASALEGEALPADWDHKQTSVSGDDIKHYLSKELPQIARTLTGKSIPPHKNQVQVLLPGNIENSRIQLLPQMAPRSIGLAIIPFQERVPGANDTEADTIYEQITAWKMDIANELKAQLQQGASPAANWNDEDFIENLGDPELALAECQSTRNEQSAPAQISSILRKMKDAHLGILILSSLTPIRHTGPGQEQPYKAVYKSCLLSASGNKYRKLPEQILHFDPQENELQSSENNRRDNYDTISRNIGRDTKDTLYSEGFLSPRKQIVSRFTLAPPIQNNKYSRDVCARFSDYFAEQLRQVGIELVDFQYTPNSFEAQLATCKKTPRANSTIETRLGDPSAKGIIVDGTLNMDSQGLGASIKIHPLNPTEPSDLPIEFDVLLQNLQLRYHYTDDYKKPEAPEEQVLSKPESYQLEGNHLARHLVLTLGNKKDALTRMAR